VINFRYHVVSTVAVFLALAIGIILGSTELQGTTFSILKNTSTQLANELKARNTQNAQLQQLVNGDEAFAQASEARLLGGLLAGQRVVLVEAPGAPGSVINGMTTALRDAGATVTGQVSLQPKLLDASQNNQQFLSSLVQQLAQPGAATGNGTPLQQAAKLLGSAILTKNNPASSTPGNSTDGKSATNSQTILATYAQGGLLGTSPQLTVPATLAVVVTPAAPPGGGVSDPQNQSLVTLAQELNTAGLGTVVTGSVTGSVGGSAIDALRGSSAGGQISSVDDADTVTGQIISVWALQQALTGHKAGSYGVGPGNTSAAPSQAPAPSASASSAQTATTSGTSSGGSAKNSGKSSKSKS
jgi:hypothetical protein